MDIDKHRAISDQSHLREDEKSIFATYFVLLKYFQSDGMVKELQELDANITSKINGEMGKGVC